MTFFFWKAKNIKLGQKQNSTLPIIGKLLKIKVKNFFKVWAKILEKGKQDWKTRILISEKDHRQKPCIKNK